jgi:hypothetical protein
VQSSSEIHDIYKEIQRIDKGKKNIWLWEKEGGSALGVDIDLYMEKKIYGFGKKRVGVLWALTLTYIYIYIIIEK